MTPAAARRRLKPLVESAGYQMIMRMADYAEPTATMTAEVFLRFRAGTDKFVVSTGTDADLDTAERDRLWQENGDRMIAVFAAAGLTLDPVPYGAHQRRTFVVDLAG